MYYTVVLFSKKKEYVKVNSYSKKKRAAVSAPLSSDNWL